MFKIINLHIHTNKSDGKGSLLSILGEIEKNKIDTFSIADHDTITYDSSIDKKLNSKSYWIPAVEISADVNIHFLYYLKKDKELKNKIKSIEQKLKKIRYTRTHITRQMLNKYKKKVKSSIGKDIKFKKLEEFAKESSYVGRSHLAEYLMDIGYAADKSFIINDTSKNGFAYIKRKYPLSIKQVMALKKKCDVLCFLAHPGRTFKQEARDKIKEFKKLGLDGFEISTADDINFAKKNKLHTSIGNDYHGIPGKDDITCNLNVDLDSYTFDWITEIKKK